MTLTLLDVKGRHLALRPRAELAGTQGRRAAESEAVAIRLMLVGASRSYARLFGGLYRRGSEILTSARPGARSQAVINPLERNATQKSRSPPRGRALHPANRGNS